MTHQRPRHPASTSRRRARADRDALPKFWQPKVTASDVLTCQIAHHHNVEEIRLGRADVDLMLDWVETIFTYAEMMKLYLADGIAITEEALLLMAEALTSSAAVVDRYNRIGKVGFNAEQLNIAKATAFLMDDLIALDRHGIALRAAEISAAAMEDLRVKVARGMLARGQEVCHG